MSEDKLYAAAITGDTKILLELLERDSYLLDKVPYTCSNRTPLHVASMKGHEHFVREVLTRNPQMAKELDKDRSSPLHVASAKGHVEIVRALVSVAPDMCFLRDCHGRNPVHVAAVNGRVEVLVEFVERCPDAVWEKADQGLSVLGLCVKYSQLEALKELVSRVSELVSWKDDDGNSILHMAVRSKHIEIVEYLVRNTNVNNHVKNSRGETPLSISEAPPQDPKKSRIKEILKSKRCTSNRHQDQPVKWLTKKRDSIMVVAVLIATMAFQAGVTPPGGVWQGDLVENGTMIHRAGEAVIAHSHPNSFKAFMRVNTIALVTSLSTILLLISGLPFRRQLFLWMLMVVMWLTVTSVAATYAISIAVVTPEKDKNSFFHVTGIALIVWGCVMVILFVGNTARLVDRWLKSIGIVMWRPRQFRRLAEVNYV